MADKTEREFDLENLEQLQKESKIDQDVDLEEIASLFCFGAHP